MHRPAQAWIMDTGASLPTPHSPLSTESEVPPCVQAQAQLDQAYLAKKKALLEQYQARLEGAMRLSTQAADLPEANRIDAARKAAAAEVASLDRAADVAPRIADRLDPLRGLTGTFDVARLAEMDIGADTAKWDETAKLRTREGRVLATFGYVTLEFLARGKTVVVLYWSDPAKPETDPPEAVMLGYPTRP